MSATGPRSRATPSIGEIRRRHAAGEVGGDVESLGLLSHLEEDLGQTGLEAVVVELRRELDQRRQREAPTTGPGDLLGCGKADVRRGEVGVPRRRQGQRAGDGLPAELERVHVLGRRARLGAGDVRERHQLAVHGGLAPREVGGARVLARHGVLDAGVVGVELVDPDHAGAEVERAALPVDADERELDVGAVGAHPERLVGRRRPRDVGRRVERRRGERLGGDRAERVAPARERLGRVALVGAGRLGDLDVLALDQIRDDVAGRGHLELAVGDRDPHGAEREREEVARADDPHVAVASGRHPVAPVGQGRDAQLVPRSLEVERGPERRQHEQLHGDGLAGHGRHAGEVQPARERHDVTAVIGGERHDEWIGGPDFRPTRRPHGTDLRHRGRRLDLADAEAGLPELGPDPVLHGRRRVVPATELVGGEVEVPGRLDEGLQHAGRRRSGVLDVPRDGLELRNEPRPLEEAVKGERQRRHGLRHPERELARPGRDGVEGRVGPGRSRWALHGLLGHLLEGEHRHYEGRIGRDQPYEPARRRVVEHEVVEVEAQVQQVVAAVDEDLAGRDRCRRQSRAQRPAQQGTPCRASRQEPQAGHARRRPEGGRAAKELEDGAPVQLAGTLSCQRRSPSSCRPVVASMTDAASMSTLDLPTWV